MNIHKKSLSVLTGAALALSLTGCISLDEPTLSDAPPSAEETEAPESESPEGVGTFGQVVSWEGVDLTVTKPKAYEPSDTAASQGPHTVSMDVKLTNTGDELLDPTLVYVSASSGGEEASAVFDVANGVDAPPTTDIKPGKSVKWTVAFDVVDPKDMTVEVTPPDFMMEPVLFSTGG